MIERQFVKQMKKEYQIEEFVGSSLKNVGHSHTKMQRTPLGEKIIIFASRPGLVVGREGKNIRKLTADLKRKFKLENPQVEINEVEDINLDARIVAERIASSLERFGISKFKGVGHKAMGDAIGSGALGIEILISGKVPSSRAKRWRFYQGYLKKCGDIALTGVNTAYATAHIKTGAVGIQVRIMPPETKLPDNIQLLEEPEEIIEEISEEKEIEEIKKGKEKTAKKEEPEEVEKKVEEVKEEEKPDKKDKESKAVEEKEPKTKK